MVRKQTKVAILLSGGVDSSVALRRLLEEGHDVTAFYLKIWLEDELQFLGECPWESDLEMVRAVCEPLGVPLQVISLQKEYWEQVVQYTLDEVKAGRTPNPDILCNQRVKFGVFYDRISAEYEKVATGHYAQVEEGREGVRLKTSPDAVKDQTYFLSQLSQEQLRRAWFPIGAYTKAEIRQMAEAYELPNRARKDSQGICFLGKIKFREFVKHHLGERPGPLIEFETGKEWGQHTGFWYYTIGQRQGLGLSGGPWFVVKKDIEANIVYISRDYHSVDKVRKTLKMEQFNPISYTPRVGETVKLGVKLRHGPQTYEADVTFIDEQSAQIELGESDQGIAAGQFAVLYDDGYCLGGGVIV